jgi:AcrR family transcriptional regulator
VSYGGAQPGEEEGRALCVGVETDTAVAQRERVIAALVDVVAERGYRAASVEAVIGRARVSRRTFYELFGSIEECFGEVLVDGLVRSKAIISEAYDREPTWEGGVREALAGLLVLFDSEPKLARVWFIESLAAASWAVEQRERYVAELRALVIGFWQPPGGDAPGASEAVAPQPDSPAVVGVMAAVLGVIHTHLLTRQPEPLISLLAPLVGIVMATYLPPAQAAREVRRAAERSRELLCAPYPPPHRPAHAALPAELPRPLRDPRAHRARSVLLYLLEHPGSSNRQIATGIGMASHTQASSLLRRLGAIGLLVKSQGGRGLANEWSLSESGARSAHAIADAQAGAQAGGVFGTMG